MAGIDHLFMDQLTQKLSDSLFAHIRGGIQDTRCQFAVAFPMEWSQQRRDEHFFSLYVVAT